MFEIIAFVLCLAMAKHPSHTRIRGRYSLRKVNTTPSVTVGTLAALTVVTGSLSGASTAQYRLISASYIWSLHGHTAGEGPYVVGYAFGDYTVTEIKEALESASSISPSDKIAQEKNNRWVRKIGTFAGDAVSETLNDGKPIKTRLNWAVQIGSTVNAFVYCEDTAANQTTGSLVELNGNMWVKDY